MGKSSIISNLVKEVLAENKRAKLKARLAKVILPILNEEVRTFREPTRHVEEFDKALKSACGDWTSVRTNLNGDRIIFDDGESGLNFSVELDIVGLDNFTMVYRLGDVKSRHKLFNLTKQNVLDFIDDDLKDRKKEREKQDKINDKKTKVEEDLDEEDDQMKDADLKDTQLKRANEVDKKAKEVPEEDKPKAKDEPRAMQDATKFKRQIDAKNDEPIAKGGKVSKAKEMDSDEEKEIKKAKMNNQA